MRTPTRAQARAHTRKKWGKKKQRSLKAREEQKGSLEEWAAREKKKKEASSMRPFRVLKEAFARGHLVRVLRLPEREQLVHEQGVRGGYDVADPGQRDGCQESSLFNPFLKGSQGQGCSRFLVGEGGSGKKGRGGD